MGVCVCVGGVTLYDSPAGHNSNAAYMTAAGRADTQKGGSARDATRTAHKLAAAKEVEGGGEVGRKGGGRASGQLT